MRTPPQKLLVWLFVSINSLSNVYSFAPCTTVYTFSSRNTRQRAQSQQQQQQLYVVASPPAEEEKEKKRDGTDSDDADWTPSRGGFLPNLKRRRPKSIQQVVTMKDYKMVVVDEQDKMVVVRFFAPWCRACKAVAPLYEQLASQYDNSEKVKFVQVPLTKQNGQLHQGLGIPSLPFAHIYHPQVGLCEEMSMNKKKFPDFCDTLETYIYGSCNVPQDYE
jgi:thiol-disulfide isomerase/thioredoxin